MEHLLAASQQFIHIPEYHFSGLVLDISAISGFFHQLDIEQ